MLGTAILLGLIQGLTEFLPISSSGHLVAARLFFNLSDAHGTAFDAFLHLGTLLAVLTYYRHVWWGIARGLLVGDGEGRDMRELAAKLAIATVPAAIVGYALQDVVGQIFRTADAVAAGLMVTAVVLVGSDFWGRRPTGHKRATYSDATYIGLAQVFALIPGISRSGMTIAGGRWRGLSRQQAAHFSFLLSAPIIAGAGLSSLQQLLTADSFPVAELVVGFIVSFLAGLLAIHVLLRIVERISFVPFAVYLVLVALLLVVTQ